VTVRRCAVVGSPIAHSLSPVLHRAAYAELGLDWDYQAREVAEQSLPAFLDGLDETWRGLSLTMPLKRSVVPLLDAMTDRARQALAANTVVLEDGRRTGHNTDIPGISAALRERYDGAVERAIVVGGGATAASAILGLADLGCRSVTLLVRDLHRARVTVETAARHPGRPDVDVRALGAPPLPADVLVSTIPAAAQDEAVLALAERVRAVFDVVYDPWPTPLARESRSHTALVSGLDLLVHQAALQVELMTGIAPAPLVVMRRAGEAALAERSASSGNPLP
jgi:shikimate dehydrogenase